ncbi:hypothetical protein C7974DRAFT_371603 [Boeremia exigua]|uniref:uncharacterized protein n=1 Tax=Boeremia exigua TaxID=749465 RepID=UPI001E8EE285|nr:uncharacterized protein C7974DRAFT_371603 [Boeremia exigua]KAH6644487.1 hypothetical protein C7974DRAFT_371603 [Boeremia exigua]
MQQSPTSRKHVHRAGKLERVRNVSRQAGEPRYANAVPELGGSVRNTHVRSLHTLKREVRAFCRSCDTIFGRRSTIIWKVEIATKPVKGLGSMMSAVARPSARHLPLQSSQEVHPSHQYWQRIKGNQPMHSARVADCRVSVVAIANPSRNPPATCRPHRPRLPSQVLPEPELTAKDAAPDAIKVTKPVRHAQYAPHTACEGQWAIRGRRISAIQIGGRSQKV